MPDSLKLGSIELNDGTTTIIDNGSDFGMPVPLTSMVERLFTDGEVVTGVRSGNRTIQIPVEIRGATRAAAALVEAQIAAQVTQAYSALTYTPQGGQPTVFDCFRGEVRRAHALDRAGDVREQLSDAAGLDGFDFESRDTEFEPVSQ